MVVDGKAGVVICGLGLCRLEGYAEGNSTWCAMRCNVIDALLQLVLHGRVDVAKGLSRASVRTGVVEAVEPRWCRVGIDT